MKRRTYHPHKLKLGMWNVQCQRCGFDFKNVDIKEEWQGLKVCYSCYEPRHPQEFLRGNKDDPQVPYTYPDSNANTSTTDI